MADGCFKGLISHEDLIVTLQEIMCMMNDSLLEKGQGDSTNDCEREDTWFEKKFGRLTNLQILYITSVMFSLFVVAEIVGALVRLTLLSGY